MSNKNTEKKYQTHRPVPLIPINTYELHMCHTYICIYQPVENRRYRFSDMIPQQMYNIEDNKNKNDNVKNKIDDKINTVSRCMNWYQNQSQSIKSANDSNQNKKIETYNDIVDIERHEKQTWSQNIKQFFDNKSVVLR